MTSASDHAMAAAALTARATVITAVLFSTTACNEPIDVATGEIALTVITTGVDIDANGYSVRVAPGSNRRIGPTETITLSRLLPGLYTLQLSGMATNCMLQGDDPGPVTVQAGQTTEVEFAITCIATTGSVRVEVALRASISPRTTISSRSTDSAPAGLARTSR
jgi:hypothetical protein